MASSDKAFAIMVVAITIGLFGLMVTPWALLAATASISAIALSKPRSSHEQE